LQEGPRSLPMEETTSSSSSSPNLSETDVIRIQKLLRHVMRMKLNIPPGKCYYVEGWGWL
jgi:hypothetical protein